MKQISNLHSPKTVPLRRLSNSVQPQSAVADHDPRTQVLTTKLGLQIPSVLTFTEWERAGQRLSGILDSSSWWLGDWLVYGKEHFADRYQRGIQAAGLQYQTLRNYAWVARRFEFHRRRPALTFQHHAELASLSTDEQDMWLDRAERENWTTKQLRSAIRFTREGKTSEMETTRRLAVPVDRIQWWHKAAEQSGIEFEQWVLATLDQAAQQVLEEVAEQAEITD
jgi:hypothetical protein